MVRCVNTNTGNTAVSRNMLCGSSCTWHKVLLEWFPKGAYCLSWLAHLCRPVHPVTQHVTTPNMNNCKCTCLTPLPHHTPAYTGPSPETSPLRL